MSKTNTKATINANIKQNGVQAITGQILNSVLNTMVDDYGTQEDLTELVNQVRKIGMNVNYRDAIRLTFPSFNVLSMRTSIVNVLDTDGTLLACILPSTMANSGWLYEYEEGWRLCKVQGFTLTNTSTWEDLLDWMDLDGNSTKIAGETAINELKAAVTEQEAKLTELEEEIGNIHPYTDEKGYHVVDAEGNIGMQYTEDGFGAAKIQPQFVEVLKEAGVATVSALDAVYAEVEETGFFFVDEQLNVGVKVDGDGIHAKNILEYEIINN